MLSIGMPKDSQSLVAPRSNGNRFPLCDSVHVADKVEFANNLLVGKGGGRGTGKAGGGGGW